MTIVCGGDEIREMGLTDIQTYSDSYSTIPLVFSNGRQWRGIIMTIQYCDPNTMVLFCIIFGIGYYWWLILWTNDVLTSIPEPLLLLLTGNSVVLVMTSDLLFYDTCYSIILLVTITFDWRIRPWRIDDGDGNW